MTKAKPANWTAEEDATLKTLWDAGWSGARVAAKMGKTRNAVLGRIHRMGLQRQIKPIHTRKGNVVIFTAADDALITNLRSQGYSYRRIAEALNREGFSAVSDKTVARRCGQLGIAVDPALVQSVAYQHQSRRNKTRAAVRAAADIPAPSLMLAMEKLRPRQCRFPTTPHSATDHRFCGHPCLPGKSYCASHLKVAYLPMKKAQMKIGELEPIRSSATIRRHTWGGYPG